MRWRRCDKCTSSMSRCLSLSLGMHLWCELTLTRLLLSHQSTPSHDVNRRAVLLNKNFRDQLRLALSQRDTSPWYLNACKMASA
jgi:hypothetical protein